MANAGGRKYAFRAEMALKRGDGGKKDPKRSADILELLCELPRPNQPRLRRPRPEAGRGQAHPTRVTP
jgi:hypothetical protein